MSPLLRALAGALAVTLLSEEAVSLLFCGLTKQRGILLACLLGNLLTNPALNLLLLLAAAGGRGTYSLCLVLLELAAWAAEAWVYGQLTELTRKEGLLLSAAANAVSFGIGMLL